MANYNKKGKYIGAKCQICIQDQFEHDYGSMNPRDICGKSSLQEAICDKAKIDFVACTNQLVYMNTEDDGCSEVTHDSIHGPLVPPMPKPTTNVAFDGQTVLGECQNKMGCGVVCSSSPGCQATWISDVITTEALLSPISKSVVLSPISKSSSRKLHVDNSEIIVGQFMRNMLYEVRKSGFRSKAKFYTGPPNKTGVYIRPLRKYEKIGPVLSV